MPEHTFNAEELAAITWAVSGRQIALSYLAYSLVAGLAMRGLEVPSIVAAIFAIVIFTCMILAYRYIKLNSLYRKPAYANSYKLRSIEFVESGIHIRGENGLSGFTPWSYVIGARNLPTHLLIFTAPGQFHAVRRSLLAVEDFMALEQLVASHVKTV